MEKKLQQTIAERDKFKEESKTVKIELASKLPDSDIAEKDEIINDLRAEGIVFSCFISLPNLLRKYKILASYLL